MLLKWWVIASHCFMLTSFPCLRLDAGSLFTTRTDGLTSREASKPRDLCLNFPIALQFDRQLGLSNFRAIQQLLHSISWFRYLTVRRPSAYWIEAQVKLISVSQRGPSTLRVHAKAWVACKYQSKKILEILQNTFTVPITFFCKYMIYIYIYNIFLFQRLFE